MTGLQWRPKDRDLSWVDEENPLPVTDVAGSGSFIVGTKSLTTTVAFAIGDQPCKEVLVQSDPDNTIDILIGDSATQVIQITPGQSLTVAVSNVSKVWAKNVTTGTQTVNWMAQI